MMSFWAFETEADWFAFNAEQMAVGEAVVAEHFVEATTSNWAGAFGNPTAEYAESVAGWNSIPHFDCAIRKVRQTKAGSVPLCPPARPPACPRSTSSRCRSLLSTIFLVQRQVIQGNFADTPTGYFNVASFRSAHSAVENIRSDLNQRPAALSGPRSSRRSGRITSTPGSRGGRRSAR